MAPEVDVPEASRLLPNGMPHGRPYQKGETGNPGGISKYQRQLRAAIERQETPARVLEVIDAMRPKDVQDLLKTVLDAKTLVVNERANAIIMRDTPENVRMAEKLVASNDVAEPEARFGPSPVEEALAALDPDGMSPREAMDALYRLKGLLG